MMAHIQSVGHIVSRNHCTSSEDWTAIHCCSLRKTTVRFEDNAPDFGILQHLGRSEVVPCLSRLLREAPSIAAHCVASLEARWPVLQPTMGGFRGCGGKEFGVAASP